MEKIQLIHPIYLDVPMLVSFAAAIQGGLSLEAEVTHEKETTKAVSAKVTGKFGLSNLFSNLFELTAETDLSGSHEGKSQEVRRESKSHTEASIAILLYDLFRRNSNYLIHLKDANLLSYAFPGALVEVAGTLEKNAVDTVIDYVDAIRILSGFAEPSAPMQPSQSKQTLSKKAVDVQQTQLDKMREILDKDRRRTPISNAILRCNEPPGINVVVTLRTANLRDLTLTELNQNYVRVVGKVTRIVGEGQRMSAFENYGFALLKPEVLKNVFDGLAASPEIMARFSEVEIQGPAVQILPLMIFV